MASVAEDGDEMAKPLHLQRLENAMRLDPFLDQFEAVFSTSLSDVDESNNTDYESGSIFDSTNLKVVNGITATKQEFRADKSRLYNFGRVKRGRKWLKNLLLSDTSDDEGDDITEEHFKMMLKIHLLKRKHRAKFIADKELKQYQYYSVGLLSNHDRFPEHQKTIVGNNKKIKEKKLEKKIKAKLRRIKKKEKRILDSNCIGLDSRGRNDDYACLSLPAFGEDGELCVAETLLPHPSTSTKGSGKKKGAAMSEAALTNKRRRLWVALSKKEIPKAQKHLIAVRKEVLTNCKKMALACQKEIRKASITFQKSLKETPGRARRLTREMLLYWKRYEKVEKEMRKKAEKEAQEQLKMDIELREAKRQQRKLNFLITQTELYAHFMSRKLSRGNHEVIQDRILNQLVDEPLPHGLIDDYDGEEAKAQALRNAKVAFETQQSKARIFDSNFSKKTNQKGFGDDFRLTDTSISTEQDRPQPNIFKGKLKVYQLKGMNWLANLYDQGINGILADEMGLGKTVQSIAFLAHVAESQDIWGPFLIIAPASTLHNWQQEFSRFLPKLKVLPYWGNTSDRKILRKFWNHKDLHTEDASFHVLITSYQLVVQDVKYFQRIKWQYMILDEAQAIKSSTSVRWKILLGFNCRNRLLLTGTPIQNSMAELWALLHFIMPTLFDSHEEFNEWFSKEIENHAENKSFIDEKHLSRLHMILKPFMLRRIKKDVENELSDKIEILLYCHLTTRQKRLYGGLKQKISIEDLLHSAYGTSSTSQAQSATSSLMNLVMQFRKVCNHPELFERREVRSPFVYSSDGFALPKLVYRDGILCHSLPSRQRLLGSLFNIYQPENVYDSIFGDDTNGSLKCFSFLRFIGLSPAELIGIILRGFIVRWLLSCRSRSESCRTFHRHIWSEERSKTKFLDHRSLLISELQPTSVSSVEASSCLRNLVFVTNTSTVYTHVDVTIHSMAETSEHRKMRAQKLVRSTAQSLLKTSVISSLPTTPSTSVIPKSPTTFTAKQSFLHKSSAHLVDDLVPEICHVERPPLVLRCEPTEMPLFLSAGCPKVSVLLRDFHCSDRSAAFWRLRSLYGFGLDGTDVWKYGHPDLCEEYRMRKTLFQPPSVGGLEATRPSHGWSNVRIPDKEALVTDSGKLFVLDGLLSQLKSQGHRVLIYSQMTRMIDILEEYMWHRKHTYMRLDGSSKISERRDMVADFQSRSDIFVFLLSTRAGGLGINLTAADTVVFYDSDWNPTVDQQAMDRAHRLGQTKQVTVYRLICKGTIEERILQRAREKSEIQRMVISGGNFKPDTLKPKEVVSLLLDDDELERKFRQRQAEKRLMEDQTKERGEMMKRKRDKSFEKKKSGGKRPRIEENVTIPASLETESINSVDSITASPSPSEKSFSSAPIPQDETSNEGSLVVDDGTPLPPVATPSFFASVGTSSGTSSGKPAITSKKNSNRSGRNTGRSRGRPKSTAKRSANARSRVGTFAATEVAGVQAVAGAAAYAAAYSGLNTSRPAGPSSGIPIGRSQVVMRGQGVRMRGPMIQAPTHRFMNPTMSNPVLPTPPSQTKGMGFYVQNNPSP